MVQEVRREDSLESWPRPLDRDLVVEFSDDEADLLFAGRDRFSEAGLDVGIFVEFVFSTEPGPAFAIRRRGGVLLNAVCSFMAFEQTEPTYPLSFRFIVDP